MTAFKVAAVFLGLVLGPVGVVGLAGGLVILSRGDVPSAIVALGAGVFSLAFVATLALAASRRVTPRISYDDTGTTIRPDLRVDRLMLTSSAAAVVAMACYAIFAPQGMINIAMPNGDHSGYVVVCVVGVVVGSFTLRQVFRAGSASYVRMTANSIETGSTMTSSERPWKDVVGVLDRAPNKRRATGATYIRHRDGHTRVVPSYWYTPDGRALHHMIDFYWKHPKYRDELVDGRVLDRLRKRR